MNLKEYLCFLVEGVAEGPFSASIIDHPYSSINSFRSVTQMWKTFHIRNEEEDNLKVIILDRLLPPKL